MALGGELLTTNPESYSGGGGGGTIGGGIASGQIAYGSGVDTITGSNNGPFWDTTFSRLGIGTNGSPQASLHVKSSAIELLRLETNTTFSSYIQFKNAFSNDLARIWGSSVNSRGGALSFYTKIADNIQTTPSREVARIDENGKFGLGIYNKEIISYKVKTPTNFSDACSNFTNYFVETNGAVTNNLYTITLQTFFVYLFTVRIIAREDNGATSNCTYVRSFKAYNDGAGAVLGTINTTQPDDNLGLGAASIAISAVGNTITIDVTGVAGKVIAWIADVQYAKVSSSL